MLAPRATVWRPKTPTLLAPAAAQTDPVTPKQGHYAAQLAPRKDPQVFKTSQDMSGQACGPLQPLLRLLVPVATLDLDPSENLTTRHGMLNATSADLNTRQKIRQNTYFFDYDYLTRNKNLMRPLIVAVFGSDAIRCCVRLTACASHLQTKPQIAVHYPLKELVCGNLGAWRCAVSWP